MSTLTFEHPLGFAPERPELRLDVEAFQAGADVESLARLAEAEATAGLPSALETMGPTEVDDEFKAITEELEAKPELAPTGVAYKFNGSGDWQGKRHKENT